MMLIGGSLCCCVLILYSKNLENYGLNTPLLQLSIMYAPLSLYLIYHFTQKGKYNEIALWKLFLCSVVDTHATILSKHPISNIVDSNFFYTCG